MLRSLTHKSIAILIATDDAGTLALLFFQPDGKHTNAERGQSLLEGAQRLGIEISAICGGVGTCGKCRMLVKEGRDLLGPFTIYEKNCLEIQDLEFGYRLACEAKVAGDGLITVEVPADSRGSKQRLQSEGLETPVKLEPSIRVVEMKITPPSLESPGSLFERVINGLEDLGFVIDSVENDCLAGLWPTLRKLDWEVVAIVYAQHKLIRLASRGTRIAGMALDIGTTKLAGYLLDLSTGKLLSKVSRINPQVLYGEDVMSRLTYILKGGQGNGLARLHDSIVKAIDEMVAEACSHARIARDSVVEVVVAGNTLMHHLVIGLDPSSLAVSPYSPVISSSYTAESEKIGLAGGRGLVVYTLPNVAGFVGADCVGDVIATGLDHAQSNQLLIDIGTNTEMVLSSDGMLWCASSPSGPTFEGAHIKHGMRAISGAIEQISIDRSHKLTYSTIDNAPARGICGSGVVDVVANMARRGIVSHSGRMNGDISVPGVVSKQDTLEYLVSRASENAIQKDITFTQRDVREVQKAKAAIASGIKILMKNASLSSGDLEQVYIAGAFGSYIDLSNAISMGMLPILPLHKIKQIGNAAGTGARMCLLSIEARRAAEDVAKRMHYIELAAWEGFQDTYIHSLELAPYS